ncbi:MAG: trigger factor [Christensenellales bacterium]|jgi:trigger factor
MNKKNMIIAAVLCMAVLFVGCSGKINPNSYITLGQYKGVEVTAMSLDVTDEEVQAEINARLESFVEYQDVTGRGVEDGDIANIDFTGYIQGETEPFEGGTAAGFDLTIGSGSFIPGFEEQIIGMAIGEEKPISVTFPQDYHEASLAGVLTKFDIKVNTIQIKVYPEVTDDFAKENLSADSAAAFEADIRDELGAEKVTQQADKIVQDAWSQALDNLTIKSLPDNMVKETKEYLDSMYRYQASSYGLEFDQFVSMFTGMTLAEFDVLMDEYAQSSVKEELMAMAIVAAEKIEVTAQEIDDLTAYYMQQNGYASSTAFYHDVMSRDDVQMQLTYEKAVDFVSANAVVTY